MDGDFAIHRSLVRAVLPRIRFLFIGSWLCSTLPSDAASRRRPCASLALHLHQIVQGTCTPKLSNMLGTRWPWRLPARAPSDPYVLILEHTVPQPTDSPPPKGPRGYPSESCGHADEPRCVRHVSLGRVCRLTLRFPPQGPPGRVPLLHRYYQSATTSGRPSRRTSFPVLGNVKGGFLIFLGDACGALLRTRPLTVAGCNPLAYSRVRDSV